MNKIFRMTSTALALLTGVEYTKQESTNQRINGFFDSALIGDTSSDRRRINGIALSNAPTIPTITFRVGTGNRSVATDLKQISAYFQDQISFGDTVDVIAGIRYDNIDLNFTSVTGNTKFARTDDLWSLRVGQVPRHQVSL